MKLKRDKYLTDDEFRRLLSEAQKRKHIHAVRDHALLAVSGLCGLRVKEAIGLRFSDLFLTGDVPYIRINSAKKRSNSTIPVREDIPIPDKAIKALVSHLEQFKEEDKRPWVRIFQITTRQAGRIFKYYAARASISPRASFHSLRHFRGVQVYSRTKDIQATKDALRHATITSTQVYVHTVDIGAIRKIE